MASELLRKQSEGLLERTKSAVRLLLSLRHSSGSVGRKSVRHSLDLAHDCTLEANHEGTE